MLKNLLLFLTLQYRWSTSFSHFTSLGENKYKLLGRRYEMEGIKAPHPEDLYDYQQVFLDHDIHCYF